MSCTMHVSGTLVVLSERAVFIWGTLPTLCSMGQFLRSLPHEMGKAWWKWKWVNFLEKWKCKFTQCSCLCWKQPITLTTLSVLVWGIKFGLHWERIFYSFHFISLQKKTYVSKLFTFELFSSIYILALLSSLYAFPVSFIRNQVFASYYGVICFTKSMIKV